MLCFLISALALLVALAGCAGLDLSRDDERRFRVRRGED